MQGLPTNLLTQNVAQAKGLMDANSSVGVNGKVGTIEGVKSGEKSQETKGAFASLFAGLLGNSETNTEGQILSGVQGSEGKESKESKESKEGNNSEDIHKANALMTAQKGPQAAESKLDVLLKNKDQEQNKKSESGVLSTEKTLSAEVLKNINNLIDRTPMAEGKSEQVVGEQVAATSNNLEQLLKTLKDQSSEANLEEVAPKKEVKTKIGNPLDFLIKESKTNDVGNTKVEGKTGIDPEMTSKLGLSSEDFLSHLAGTKDVKGTQEVSDKMLGQTALDQDAFDPKTMVQKQMNQSMKAYGQKQNLLSDNIIRSPKDLMTKESKNKSTIDELKSPDMKIGAELSHIKDPFIVASGKQDQAQNAGTQESEKVLDLSKMSTTNSNEIIKKISDYIQQGQVANKDQIDLTVRHDSLGEFKIQVNKPVGSTTGQMDMQITTKTAEGHDFFMKNEIGLMKNLSQAGIQLSDLRIVAESGSSAFAGNDSRQQSSNSQHNSQSGREFMSFDSGDSSGGSQRRKELWQEAKNQQRYGA